MAITERIFSWGFGLLAIVLALLTAGGPARVASPAQAGPRSSLAEPAVAAAFVAAYGRGDETTAERLASPLYHLEWARRGLSPNDRSALRAVTSPHAARSRGQLAFRYVDGLVDDAGFRHLLYVVTPDGEDRPAARSVWRVDTDRDGRVIWAELVYLFSDAASDLAPLVVGPRDASRAIPDAVASLRPEHLVGIRSSRGTEGYYALAAPAEDAADESSLAKLPTTRVVFLAVDAEGNARPGVWSYGDSQPSLVAYGQARAATPVPVPADETHLLSAYLTALR
jgi:hypothetical protein